MVHTVATPVLVQQRNIQVPVGHFVLTCSQLGLCTRTHREGTEAWRAAETFLAAAVGQINLPSIQVKRNATEGGHRVEQEQAIVLSAQITDPFHRLTNAGGRFGMDHRQDRRLVLLDPRFDLFKTECLTPGLLNHLNVGAVTTGHIQQAIPEVSLHCNKNRIPGFDGVSQRGFHG